jgi:predicted nucleotidyltransferase
LPDGGDGIVRLTGFQISLIRDQSLKHFGSNSRVWLFGSRVDDSQRGGDIDLYVESDIQDPAALVDAKLHFMLEIHRILGDQKIDLVLHRNKCNRNLPIYRIAKETGERLL